MCNLSEVCGAQPRENLPHSLIVEINRNNHVNEITQIIIVIFVGERYYVTFPLWHKLSVRLSSVTFVRGAPVQTVELFVNVLHHLIAQERGQIAPERGQFLFVGSLYYFFGKKSNVF